MNSISNTLHQPPINLALASNPLSYRFCDEENKLEVRLELDPEKDVFLKHHFFGNACLTPATVMLELLSEAAVLSAIHLGIKTPNIVEVKDFVIERAIPINISETKEINLFALLDSNDEKQDLKIFRVEVCSDAKSASGKIIRKNRRHCFGIISVDSKPRKREFVELPLQGDLEHFDLGKEFTYRVCYPTHGSLFQGLNGRLTLFEERQGLIGQFDMKMQESKFVVDNDFPFITSPLGYDCALQIQVMTAIFSTTSGRLPIGGKGLKIYRKPNPEGLHYVIIRRVSEDDTLTVSNVTIVTNQLEKVAEFSEFKLQKQTAWKMFDKNELSRWTQYKVEELSYI